MGPVLVVEVLELPQRVEEVSLIPDERAVQQLVTAGLHPAFHDRIHPRHPDPAEDDLDPRVVENGVEQGGKLAVRSRIRNRARLQASSRSMTRFLAAWVTQEAVGCAVAPEDPDPAAGVLDHRQYVEAGAGRVTVSKKSQARRASAWERRKPAQVVDARSGAGGIPACCSTSHTVEAATYPEDQQFAVEAPVAPARVLLGQAQHQARMERTVRGRPRRWGRDRAAWRRASKSRCQRSTVSGRTSSRIRRARPGEPVQQRCQERPVGAAKRLLPSWRSSTAI